MLPRSPAWQHRRHSASPPSLPGCVLRPELCRAYNAAAATTAAARAVAEAALGLLASKVDSTLAGLKAALGGVLRVAGLTGARYEALAAPIIDAVGECSVWGWVAAVVGWGRTV